MILTGIGPSSRSVPGLDIHRSTFTLFEPLQCDPITHCTPPPPYRPEVGRHFTIPQYFPSVFLSSPKTDRRWTGYRFTTVHTSLISWSLLHPPCVRCRRREGGKYALPKGSSVSLRPLSSPTVLLGGSWTGKCDPLTHCAHPTLVGSRLR